MTAEESLKAGLEQFGLPHATQPFMQYLALLLKWNKAFNLTAITDERKMVTRHILDSLAILPFLEGRRILDLGSGAGLPGIPLALALPEREFVLLDANGKKTRFLEEVKRQLQLDQVEIVQSRAENYHPACGFDTLTSRAVSDLEDLVHNSEHLLEKNGIWLAMKGKIPNHELSAITLPYQVAPYQVPGLNEERCCVIIKKI